MKSVAMEAFIEMVKLVAYGIGGGLLAFFLIYIFGPQAVLMGFMITLICFSFYALFRAKCTMIEIRREREARKENEKS